MHWFRKTPWHVVSAGSIRRSQLAFAWSSAYLSRPCHASRCFINISKNRRRPVFFYLSQKLAKQFVKITSQTGCYTCIDEGGVYCVVYCSTIRFLFFSFSFSAWQLQRSGWKGALMNRCTPRRCLPAPTLPHVTLFATRSFPTFVGEGARRTQTRRRRCGEGRYSRSPGAQEFVTGKKRRWKPIN